MSVVLAKCLQILEIHHLKNNFQGIQKATENFNLSCFLLIIKYRDNATLIETASNSVSMALVVSIVNSKIFFLYCFINNLLSFG